MWWSESRFPVDELLNPALFTSIGGKLRRNYAWHYSRKIYKTRFQWVKELFLRRLPHGIALGLAATVVINGFDHWRRQQEHHVSTAEH
ncbi:unnamed protein product [Trichobilharzia regenti]|nr:unnamed protein product [Trichobilharzia regenti]